MTPVITNGLPPLPLPLPPLPPPPPPPSSTSSSSSSSTNNGPPLPPLQNPHHVPLLTAHSFLYNPVEPYIIPITIPPGFPSTAPEFMRYFAPNMAPLPVNPTNPTSANLVQTSNVPQGSVSNGRPTNANSVQTSNAPQGSASNGRPTTQTNGTNTPPEQNGQTHRPSPPPQSSSRQQQQQSHPPSSQQQHQQQQQYQPQHSHHRQRQYHQSDSISYQQQNGFHLPQQRQSQSSYSQQQTHIKPKACYTCGDVGHLAFACPEQYSSESNYPITNRGNWRTKKLFQ